MLATQSMEGKGDSLTSELCQDPLSLGWGEVGWGGYGFLIGTQGFQSYIFSAGGSIAGVPNVWLPQMCGTFWGFVDDKQRHRISLFSGQF